MPIETLAEAIKFLEHDLPRSSAEVFSGRAGLKRSQRLFALLGNPQEKLKVIHIAGTSGKGTTAMMLSAILAQHGKHVGMSLSPHVYSIRERCQLNNQMITQPDFISSLNHCLPAIARLQKQHIRPTYFESLLALALVAFVRKKVDYAILETGLGGLIDATNTIHRQDKICILTKIGYDHMQVLGNTLADIAYQKAGIIQPGNQVFTIPQQPAAARVIKATTVQQTADLQLINPASVVNEFGPLQQLNDQLWGEFQNENAALAIAGTRYLAERDNWPYQVSRVKSALQKLYLPGRFEQIKVGKKTFVLDGAHNQQKLKALLSATRNKYPNQPYGIILAMRETKTISRLDSSQQVITTSFDGDFQDMPIQAKAPTELAAELKSANPGLSVSSAPSPREALGKALQSQINLWLVTGSFFILKAVRDRLEKIKQ